MRFAKGVYLDEETLILGPGAPLKQKDIDRLIRWDIEEVQTEGGITVDSEQPGLSATEAIDTERVKSYLYWVQETDGILQDVQKETEMVQGRVDDLVGEMVDEVRQHANELIQLILTDERSERSRAASCVHCTVLAVLIGKSVGFIGQRLSALALGAYLHDIGMLRVAPEVVQKEGELAPEETAQIKAHPVHGYNVILNELKYPLQVATIALQHHERWDGSGYPRRLKADKIDLAARIVTVADAFEAMISQRAYKSSVIGYTAMKSILSENSRGFDPTVVKAFLGIMGVFPIGGIVQLNDGSIGRVIEVHENAPLRPEIRLYFDENGIRLSEGTVVDLRQSKGLYIARAIDPKDLEQDSSDD